MCQYGVPVVGCPWWGAGGGVPMVGGCCSAVTALGSYSPCPCQCQEDAAISYAQQGFLRYLPQLQVAPRSSLFPTEMKVERQVNAPPPNAFWHPTPTLFLVLGAGPWALLCALPFSYFFNTGDISFMRSFLLLTT